LFLLVALAVEQPPCPAVAKRDHGNGTVFGYHGDGDDYD
jgi:hypothetical protein